MRSSSPRSPMSASEQFCGAQSRVIWTITVLNAYLGWPYVSRIFRIDRHVTDLNGGTVPRWGVA